jgi:hypothetical protein
MVPSSEELEAFSARVTRLRVRMAARGAAQLAADSPLRGDLATIAMDWLRLSERLRIGGVGVDLSTLATCDQHMTEVLARGRRRATYYRIRLRAVEDVMAGAIIAPVARHEGDPRQVITRQLRTSLVPHLTPQEAAYADEALKCIGESCHRAGIVLLWAAAVTRLHHAIDQVGYPAFNAALAISAARKGYPFIVVKGQGPIASVPELQRVADFVILIVGMDLWQYDGQAFAELAAQLQTRNNAAHPGMATPGLLEVQVFTNKLIERIFKVIPP